jgi:hypothetical protein
MKSVCFFVCYVEGDHKQDMSMIHDLLKCHNKVIVVTNKPLSVEGVQVLVMPNLGYDFGFFYRALGQVDISGYDMLSFVNNSNVLVKGRSLSSFFTWVIQQKSNLCGITDSFEAPKGVNPTRSYHIQSHLLVFKGAAVGKLLNFFKKIDFERFFSLSNQTVLRQSIINECEIGLTQYMLSEGESAVSQYGVKQHAAKYNHPINTNMHVHLWEELIQCGYPLMKKKILTGEWAPLLRNINNKNRYL